MSSQLGAQLQNYYVSLQDRFGDPRVYAAQQNQMRAQEARVMHTRASDNATLLRDAYASQQKTNTETHKKRMSKKRATLVAPK